jgi:2,3-dihydroxybiphenyl 1,2-dioxygenase
MPRIKSLGYIGCRVSDLNAWDRFLNNLFGLTYHSDSLDDAHRFHVDGHDHWLTFQQSDRDSLSYIGWEVYSREGLQAFAKDLAERGIHVSWADENLRAERGVEALLSLSGPDNVCTELYFGPVKRNPARSSGDLGLGHVVLGSADRRASVDWYSSVFGFQVSDHIFWDGVEASFLRCNPRHHSLALTNPVGDMRGGDLGHFMLEANSLDDVGRAYDTARASNIPVAFTFGRHSNDAAISFYVYSPSGWLVEYGYGGRMIDDPTWQPRLYGAPSIWGHELQPPPSGDRTKQRY